MYPAIRSLIIPVFVVVCFSVIQSETRALEVIPTPGSYYTFDETTGSGTISDSIRGAYGLGTIRTTGGATTTGTFTTGRIGNAMVFNGSTYVEMNAAFGGSQYTVSSWVYLDSVTVWGTILKNWGETTTGALHLGLDNVGPSWSNSISTTATAVPVVAPSAATSGQWVNVATTYDGNAGELKLYINGSSVATTAATGSVNVLPLMSMGVKLNDAGTAPAATNTGWLTGKLDDIAIWNTTLTPAQMSTIYTNGLNGIPVAAPEPSTYAFAAASLLTLAVAARRKARRRSFQVSV